MSQTVGMLGGQIDVINRNIDSLVDYYNRIIGLESHLLTGMNQINGIIMSLDFVQEIQNAILLKALRRVQEKYSVTVSVIADLSTKRREYFEKMMNVVVNKQKLLQQLSMEVVKHSRNPLRQWVNDLSGNRDVLAILRAYYEQSVIFARLQDARDIVNHRLNMMYSYVAQLQSQFVTAIQDYMSNDIVVQVDRISASTRSALGQITQVEKALVSLESTYLTKETSLTRNLGLDSLLGMMMGGAQEGQEAYVNNLLKAFSDLASGQNGGAIAVDRVPLLASVVPRINDVDMVSFGGVLSQRLEQCQHAAHILTQRLKDAGDFNDLEMAILSSSDNAAENFAKKITVVTNTFNLIQNITTEVNKIQKPASKGDLYNPSTTGTTGVFENIKQHINTYSNIVNPTVIKSFVNQLLVKMRQMDNLKKLFEEDDVKTGVKELTETVNKLKLDLTSKLIITSPPLSPTTVLAGGARRRRSPKKSAKKLSGGKKRKSSKRKSSGKRKMTDDMVGGKKRKSSKKSKKLSGGKKRKSSKKSSKRRSGSKKH